LAAEFEGRANRLSDAVDEAFVLANDGALRFVGEVVARLSAGEKLLEPRLRLLADDLLTPAARDKVQARLDLWLKAHVEKLLGPLLKLETAESVPGIGRGIAFQIGEALGVLERSRVAEDMKHLDQEGRAALRALGVSSAPITSPSRRCAAPPARPGGATLGVEARRPRGEGAGGHPALASSGRTSIPVDKEVQKGSSRGRFPGVRRARGSGRHSGAAGGPDWPAIHFRPGITLGEPPWLPPAIRN
jgi:ATP-dependent RNA helicase SUPV3L1/SUV3